MDAYGHVVYAHGHVGDTCGTGLEAPTNAVVVDESTSVEVGMVEVDLDTPAHKHQDKGSLSEHSDLVG